MLLNDCFVLELGIGNDPARNMLSEIRRAYNLDIIAIAEPKILLRNLYPRFWRKMQMTFLDENSRGGGLRSNLWVAFKSSLQTIPTVFLNTEQVLIIKFSSLNGDMYFGFIHASNSYIERRLLWDTLLPLNSLNICFI